MEDPQGDVEKAPESESTKWEQEASDSEEHATDNETSSSDGDEEEEEPMFSYSRITGLPPTFFHKDAVSCVLIHESVYVFATHSGIVHLANTDMTPLRTVRNHRASIVDISCDGQYVATASIDGTVVILSITDTQDVVPASFNRPVHCVALDPNYKNTKCYFSGGTAGTVIKSEKGWLRGRKDTVLYESTSTVLAIKWCGTRAIWCTEEGIIVYDTSSSTILQRIARLPNSPQANLYRPQITPSNIDSRVLVGWGSSIWILDLESPDIVLSSFNVEWLLSGLTFFHDKILLLCSRLAEEPELRLMDYTGSETYADELSLVDYSRLGPNDYHLQGSGPFYLVSAKDAVIARERDVKDHVDWLMGRGQFVEAYNSSEKVCDDPTRKRIGLKAVESLIELQSWTDAGKLLKSVLGTDDANEWEIWSKRFLDHAHYFSLGDNLPNDLAGLDDVRTSILEHAATTSSKKFLEYVQNWDFALYDSQSVLSEVESSTDPTIIDARARLHRQTGDPLRAVEDYLKLGSSNAFKVTSEYYLWGDTLPLLAKILRAGSEPDIQSRLSVLVANNLQVSPKKVVEELQNAKEDQLLLWYLELLGSENELLIRPFGDLLVKLYGEFARDKLKVFLTRNDNYNLSVAIQVCESKQYTEELVYLLGRVGQTQKALGLLLDELNAVEQAVEFAAQHDEAELWNTLIMHSTSKPELVIRLLRCPQVSPVQVLLKVPEHLQIPGLKKSLLQIFENQSAVIDLNYGALAVFRSESKSLLTGLQKSRHAGVKVDAPDDMLDEGGLLVQGEKIMPVSELDPQGEIKVGFSTLSSKIRKLARLITFASTNNPAPTASHAAA